MLLFFVLCYNKNGEYMKIGVDKHNYMLRKKDDNEYIYVFENENLSKLIKTKMHCIHVNYIDYLDINTTNYNINCKRKMTINDDFDYKKRDYKIGIIIPNCNYEHTIRKCLSSIAEQIYKNYEVIFIDDMSTDNSVKIAYEFINKLTNIKIVELKQKRYNGGARNEGYLYLSDDVDYVFCVDSDDWLYDKYSLQKINDALYEEPDVLFGGLAKCRNQIITKEKIPDYKDRYEAMEGWSGVSKIIKKSLATRQECLYNEGTLKEDKNQHCKICFYMNDFRCLKDLIYVWNQDNKKSVTTIREKVIWGTSTIRHYADTLQLALSVKGQDEKIDKIMQERVEKCKEEVRIGGDRQW